MKLFFCDICNESIPLQDIKDNRATTIKGKIFCRACNPLNELVTSDGPTAQPVLPARAESSFGGSIALLYVGLVASLGASGYLLYERAFSGAEQGQRIASRVDRVEEDVAESKQNMKMIAGNLEGLSGLRALPARLDRIDEEVARARGELTTVGTAVAAAEKNLNTVGSLRERLDQLALRQDEITKSIGRLEGIVGTIQSELREVADRPPVIVTNDSGDAEGTGTDPAAGTGEAVVGVNPKLAELVEKLGSSDAMVRWEAVDQVRVAKEKALIPHVVKLLADRDTFVRAQAIYTLGELKATKAVPDLIKLLRDDEQMIREEALTALVEITGQTIKFDLSNKTEREKGIKRWEEWLAKNKDTL
jgi:archaellum component FlaC